MLTKKCNHFSSVLSVKELYSTENPYKSHILSPTAIIITKEVNSKMLLGSSSLALN